VIELSLNVGATIPCQDKAVKTELNSRKTPTNETDALLLKYELSFISMIVAVRITMAKKEVSEIKA